MADCCINDVTFCVTRGDTEELLFTFPSFSTMVGYDFKMVVVLSTALLTPVLTFTVGSGITVSESAKTAAVIYSIANTTALTDGATYYSDLKVTYPDATVRHVPLRFVHSVSTPVTP